MYKVLMLQQLDSTAKIASNVRRYFRSNIMHWHLTLMSRTRHSNDQIPRYEHYYYYYIYNIYSSRVNTEIENLMISLDNIMDQLRITEVNIRAREQLENLLNEVIELTIE